MQPKDTFFSRKLTINCKGELIDLSFPKVMGIVNITPDSFYDGGKYTSAESLISQIDKMILEGCDIFDIGAYSSRPGTQGVTEDEELKRLSIALKVIREKFPKIIISVDTFRSNIARQVVQDFDVDIINDISAGEMDKKMFETIAELRVPYIMMHMQGTPENMQENPQYENIVKSIVMYFSKKIDELSLLGVNDVILDPGFGFGKTLDHNYQLLKHLDDFKIFELPILAGVSRKSMICKPLEIKPQDALNGTTVVNTLALMGGANILRVHDVKAALETIKLHAKFDQAKVENWHD
ncbi:MAG: dihydropteroate synthase [Bacteroidales bacterium]|nr:dihydropteroate synthase [Bacteroidales bacterium]